MPTLEIRSLETPNQTGNDATLFHPYFDGLGLKLVLHASPDILQLRNPVFGAFFQIFSLRTEDVVVERQWFNPFAWGADFWIAMGTDRNGLAVDSPATWGLDWSSSGSA